MNDILLDSNILIYFLDGIEKTLQYLGQLKNARFYMSAISQVEVLAGSHKHGYSISDTEMLLGKFICLPLDQRVARQAAQLIEKGIQTNNKVKDFADTCIAATAIAHKLTLLTNNPKDFKSFPGLKTLSYTQTGHRAK